MKPARIVLVVLASLLVLVGLGMSAAGTGATAAHLFGRDADGYLTSPRVTLTTESHALTAEDLEFVESGTVFDRVTSTWWDARLRVEPADPDASMFVGIGPAADVAAYLSGVAHDQVVHLNGARTPRYREVPGDGVPTPPAEFDFWVARTQGSGAQILDWEPMSGRWALVVMRADGEPGLTVQARAGVRSDLLLPIALVLLLAGFGLIAGGTAIVLAVLHDGGPRPVPAAYPTGPVVSAVSPVAVRGHLDPTLTRWQWLVKWLLAIPHVVILVLLWMAFVPLTFVAGVAILFTGRYPRAIFDFNVGVLRWTWRVTFYAFGVIGTDRYPPFSLARTDYPADLDIVYPHELSRGLVLVKWWLLAIPHYLVVAVLTGGALTWTWRVTPTDVWQVSLGGGLIGLLVLIAGAALLATAAYPPRLFELIMGCNRWVYRVVAYAALMTDVYPPFRLDQGGEEPGGEPPPPDAPPRRAAGERIGASP